MLWHTRLHRYTARSKIRSSSQLGRRRGYGWGLPAENPYRTKQVFTSQLKVKLWLVFLTAAILFGLLLYHPFFHIQKIIVTGQERLTEAEIIQATAGIMNTRRLWIFPGRSYLISDVDEVKSILQEKFPLQSIIVQKAFPQEIRITLEEKLSTIIYDNGKQYSYLGLDGKVLEIVENVTPSEWRAAPLTTSTPGLTATSTEPGYKGIHVPDVQRVMAELGNYPIVYDTRGENIRVNQTVLDEEILHGIIAWFQFFAKQTNTSVAYFILADDGGAGQVVTVEGWKLMVRLAEQREEQMESLQFMLKEKITDRQMLKLIDLRFPGRVYWE